MGKVYSINNKTENFNKNKDSYIILFENGYRKFYTFDQISKLINDEELIDVFDIDDDVIEENKKEDMILIPKEYFIKILFDEDKIFNNIYEKHDIISFNNDELHLFYDCTIDVREKRKGKILK